MSGIQGVCTCGEVMYSKEDYKGLLKVVTHRAKVLAEVVEKALIPNAQWVAAEAGEAKLLNIIEEIILINPEDHATQSRDYGRGFSDALKQVHQIINGG